MKWQFHLTVFVKNLPKALPMISENQRISFSSKNFKGKAGSRKHVAQALPM
jgi:hypothetical protein